MDSCTRRWRFRPNKFLALKGRISQKKLLVEDRRKIEWDQLDLDQEMLATISKINNVTPSGIAARSSFGPRETFFYHAPMEKVWAPKLGRRKGAVAVTLCRHVIAATRKKRQRW